MRKLALLALLAALLQNAGAQRMGAAPHFAMHSGPQGSTFGPRSFAYPIPFFTDSLYSDAFYTPGYAAVQPTFIVMQAQPAAAPERVQPPAQPLLIELQGDRYVRISGDDASGTQMIDQDAAFVTKDQALRPGVPREVHAAVLVFRDGQSEEVSDYTIANGILYAGGNYYTDGSWNKKVELLSLNLPETIAANRSRGIRFRLPSSPNEVIVGP